LPRILEIALRRASFALMLVASCLVLSRPAWAAEAPTPAQLARAQIEAAASRDWPTLRSLYAPDVRYVDPNGEARGADATIATIERTLQPFGTVTVAIGRVYEGRDYAVAEWTSSAINSAEITLADGSKVPPTDNEVNLSVVTIYDVKDGRIVSERSYYDALAMFGALGLLGD
jgi:limonene-1,2-epoxide hydrolase